jgi:hypothetical protein
MAGFTALGGKRRVHIFHVAVSTVRNGPHLLTGVAAQTGFSAPTGERLLTMDAGGLIRFLRKDLPCRDQQKQKKKRETFHICQVS